MLDYEDCFASGLLFNVIINEVNDYYQSFSGYMVTADVYDLNSRKVWSKSVKVDLPEDVVINDV